MAVKYVNGLPRAIEKKKLIEPSVSSTLQCYFQNVRGLNTKFQHFYSAVSDGEFDLVTLCETGLHEEVEDSEFFSDAYTVYRKDRKFDKVGKSSGGGVLLAVKNFIRTELVPVTFLDEDFPSIDVLVCKCSLAVKTFCVAVVYIPPYVTTEAFDMFFERFEQIAIFHSGDVVIVGRF